MPATFALRSSLLDLPSSTFELVPFSIIHARIINKLGLAVLRGPHPHSHPRPLYALFLLQMWSATCNMRSLSNSPFAPSPSVSAYNPPLASTTFSPEKTRRTFSSSTFNEPPSPVHPGQFSHTVLQPPDHQQFALLRRGSAGRRGSVSSGIQPSRSSCGLFGPEASYHSWEWDRHQGHNVDSQELASQPGRNNVTNTNRSSSPPLPELPSSPSQCAERDAWLSGSLGDPHSHMTYEDQAPLGLSHRRRSSGAGSSSGVERAASLYRKGWPGQETSNTAYTRSSPTEPTSPSPKRARFLSNASMPRSPPMGSYHHWSASDETFGLHQRHNSNQSVVSPARLLTRPDMVSGGKDERQGRTSTLSRER